MLYISITFIYHHYIKLTAVTVCVNDLLKPTLEVQQLHLDIINFNNIILVYYH